MQIVPLQPLPNQTLQVQLSGQACTINVYQLAYGLFLDLLVDNVPIVTSIICEDRNKLVRSLYQGFDGNLAFRDTQGSADPVYTGLGDRWQLVYLEPADLEE